VAALLTGNRGLEVLTCLSALHHERAGELRAVFSDYRPKIMDAGLSVHGRQGQFPASLWLATTDGASG
jgi:hypothetical protein